MAQNTKQDVATLAKTSGFAKGANTLFTNPSAMTPTQIVQLLSMAGIKVPTGVAIGADMAQILISGGAIASDISMGASIGAFVSPTAAIMSATMDVLGKTGLIDPSSPMAQIITVGIDVALIIGSCGTNVIADLKFVMDIASIYQSQAAGGQADAAAKRGISDYINARRASQMDAFATNFADYHNGKISIFGLMVDTAKDAPELFYNFFPQAASFIPPNYLQVTAIASATTLTGSATVTESQNFQSTMGLSIGRIEYDIFQNYIGKYLDQYKTINTSSPDRMSIESLAMLSLMPPFIDTFPEKFDIVKYLSGYSLTFSDLGEGHIIPQGIDYLMLKNANQKKIFTQAHANMIKFDSAGDFPNMIKWMDVNTYHYLLNNSMPRWNASDIGATQSAFCRQIRNFWSALSMLESAKVDQAFADANSFNNGISSTTFNSDGSVTRTGVLSKLGIPQQYDPTSGQPLFGNIFKKYDDLETIQAFSDKAKKLNFLSHCRGLNKLATQKIASFLNTTPDKLYIQNKADFGSGPAVFGVNK